eukprot:3499717-Rhodomonas_salina.1
MAVHLLPHLLRVPVLLVLILKLTVCVSRRPNDTRKVETRSETRREAGAKGGGAVEGTGGDLAGHLPVPLVCIALCGPQLHSDAVCCCVLQQRRPSAVRPSNNNQRRCRDLQEPISEPDPT